MPSIAQPADRDFEITFADLAHAQLRDKAPALLDYLLGFQVIEQNEDQTHAVGVLGFRTGEQMLFVPSFFLNGELKQCLIYVKNQDLFVPLQDNWVQYLLSRRPQILGEVETRSPQDLGVLHPDLSALSNTSDGTNFNTRFASYKEPWVKENADALQSMFAKINNRYKDLDTLDSFLKKTANNGTQVALLKSMRNDPVFANAVTQYYALDQLAPKRTAHVKKASRGLNYKLDKPVARSPLLHSLSPARGTDNLVKVLFGKSAASRVLIDSDKEKLLRGEILVKDSRDESNTAYRSDSEVNLTNPTDNGEYELLLSNGEFRDVCIFVAPKTAGKGYVRTCLVIDKDTKNFAFFWASDLWIKPNISTSTDKEKKFYDGLSSISSVKPGNTYVAISSTNIATVPFKVQKKTSGKYTELFVTTHVMDPGPSPRRSSSGYNAEENNYFRDGQHNSLVGDTTRNTNTPQIEWNINDDDESCPSCQPCFYGNIQHIVITDDKRDIRVVGKTLFVPEDAKVCKVTDSTKAFESWSLADPGSLLDVEVQLLKAGAKDFSLLRKASSYYVNNLGPFEKLPLVEALVKKAGLRGNAALAIVNGLKDDKRERFLVKNNVGYAPPFPEPEYGYDDYSGVTEQYPQDELLPVEDNYDNNPDAYLGKPDRQQIMQAAETGQKDVFDTSAIASLVRTSNSDDLITQFLSDIILGLDRVNRILFMYYWLNEQFRDRYGQESLVELEDQLKNVSKSLGDLVLFLKQRQVEGMPNYDAFDTQLGAV